MASTDWYSIGADEVLQRLESSPQGLSAAVAKQRLAEFGPNTLPEKKQRALLMILLEQFRDFMILVLLAAALISGLVGEPQDTIAILVIVLLNAIIGAVQELRAERAVAALRQMSAPEAHVVRDEQGVAITAAELVPGDVVVLQAGDIVPADLRLLDVEEMLTDESALTGESTPVNNEEEEKEEAESEEEKETEEEDIKDQEDWDDFYDTAWNSGGWTVLSAV
mgnify:CR=1 FL=1